MKVYVITREVSRLGEGTDTRVLFVVSNEADANRIIKRLKKNSYMENCAETCYDYDEYELDTINTDNLWDNEMNIMQ